MGSILGDYPPMPLTFSRTLLPVCVVSVIFNHLLVEGRNWDIDFWDTAGQDKFNHVHSSYYADVHCCIIVFDVTRKLTYKNLYARSSHLY
jgi:GTPase SAR1 family protein